MNRRAFVMMLSMVLAVPLIALSHVGKTTVVDVRIVSDRGGEFAKHRAYPRVRQEGSFFYVEAIKGDRYSIEVTNRSGRRIAAVIAVDGRNIINGAKSDLKRDEPMYVIGPFESNTFEGWRTGMDRTNRFYFTEPSDSYAEKVFADASAMGTIALAVYAEKVPEIHPFSQRPGRMKEPAANAAPSTGLESRCTDSAEQKKDKEAGTGFGETTHSPSYIVAFQPESLPAEKIVLKYEWRSELCRKGILHCGPKNRFWPDDQFVPIPRDFRD
jgi:hypothetical protein